jgi:hypothetical protein
MTIDINAYIQCLEQEYPKYVDDARDCGCHISFGSMSHDTESAIQEGDWETVQKHFDFVDRIFTQADEYISNGIYVSYLENVLLYQTEPKYLQARSLLSPQLKLALHQLEAHFKWLSNERPINRILNWISGPIDLSPAEFEEHYRSAIDEALIRGEGEGFIVGDAPGADTLAQQYLFGKTSIVYVYHLADAPLYDGGFQTIGGFGSIEDRDRAMTLASDAAICWVRSRSVS